MEAWGRARCRRPTVIEVGADEMLSNAAQSHFLSQV